ncbi:DUF637 domain-containing protein [Pseudomonas nitroreducens]|uniref:DUF637 domain-containing protein n=1 Tax=Pseudomonas nitroreducens TaxID=46680 RepID=UPI003B847F71
MVARTGQRYIDGMASDEALFKYLMDNAIAYKDSLQLQLGVGLSAEQVAALTHDIVWLEEATINGEKVLVPVLYLAQAEGRLAANGALIMGNDLSLISGGNLTNQGTLRASGDLAASATNLNNSGLIEAGNRLDLLAIDSIRNAAGGIISGRDVSLTALTGDVINERSITSVDASNDAHRIHQEIANNAARIEARGDLEITAGRDLRLEAAQEVDSFDFQSRRVTGNVTSVTQHGSDVQVGGNLELNAGRDLSAVASRIDAARDIAMSAGRDVVLASAANEEHSDAKYKGGGKKVTTQEDHVGQQATEVTAGGDVLISAGENLTLVSSKIGAGNEAYLVAGDKIELLAANDSDYSLYDMEEKGGWGKKKTQRDEVTDVRAVGSEISAGSDITLLSGGDQKYQGAKLDAGNDIAILSGGQVTFEAVKDLHQESHAKSDGDLAWTSSKGEGKTDETLRQTQMIAQGNIAIKAVDGLKIDYKHIDQKSVSQAIDAMVQADPNLAWIKEAEARGDVDWRAVKEIHDSYKYSNSGLGAAPQLIIAIVASYFLGPLYGAMASNLAVGTINNGGDIGQGLEYATTSDALKSYAMAGVGEYVISPKLDSYFKVSTDTANQVTKGFDLSTWAGEKGIGAFAAYNSAQALSQAVMQQAAFGGSFADNLMDAFSTQAGNLGMAVGFNGVGDWAAGQYGGTVYRDGSLQKIVAHALMGGLLAEATGSDFKTGAMAAGVNEALANVLHGWAKGDPKFELMESQIVGVLAAAAVNGDVGKGAEIAKNATAYNQQVHREAYQRLEQGLDALHAQGKYEGVEPEAVLYELNRIASGEARTVADLDPKIAAFLGAEFSPATLRDTLFEPSDWENGAALLVDLLSPTPGGKAAAVEKVTGKISKDALEALEKKFAADAAEKAAKGVVGFSDEAAKVALSNVGRVDHSARHLIDAGIITANSGSKAAREAFQEIGEVILTNPMKTFDHVMVQGGQRVKGFYRSINGNDVVIFVAKEARGKIAAGDIVTAITPSPQQMKNFGL